MFPLAITLGTTVGPTTGGGVIRLTATGDAADAITNIAFDATSASFEDAGIGIYDVTVPAHAAGSVTVTATAWSETATATYAYQLLTPTAGYTIFLQLPDGTVDAIPCSRLPDGTVDAIPCSPGLDAYHVVLSRPPKIPLSVDAANFARATFQLVRNDSKREQAFMLTEREPQSNFTSTVRAVNYDSRYYQHDADWPSEDELPFAGEPWSPDWLWGPGCYPDEQTAFDTLVALDTLTNTTLPAKDFDPPERPTPPQAEAPVVIVTVSPYTAALAVDGFATQPSAEYPSTKQFTAAVTGAANTAVTWAATAGSVTGGLYTAPGTAGNATVTATSVADGSKSASAAVTVTHPAQDLIDAYGSETIVRDTVAQLATCMTSVGSRDFDPFSGFIYAPVTVSIDPDSVAAVDYDYRIQFTATVTGTSNPSVTWATTDGTISSSGLLDCPMTPGLTITVTATSVADPTAHAHATVTT